MVFQTRGVFPKMLVGVFSLPNEDAVQRDSCAKEDHGQAKRVEGLSDAFGAVDERSDQRKEGDDVHGEPEPRVIHQGLSRLWLASCDVDKRRTEALEALGMIKHHHAGW